MATTARQEASYFGRAVKEIEHVVAEGFTSDEMANYLALEKEEVNDHVLAGIPILTSLTATPETGEAGVTEIAFSVVVDPDGGVPATWDFFPGDGSPAITTAPPWAYTYPADGTFEAFAIAVSAGGNGSQPAFAEVVITPASP